MALTLKNISRTGLGQLKIHFINGNKTTLTAWCSRSEIRTVKQELKSINGIDCKFHKIFWNGKLLAA